MARGLTGRTRLAVWLTATGPSRQAVETPAAVPVALPCGSSSAWREALARRCRSLRPSPDCPRPPEREALGVRGEKGQRQPRARPGTGGARSGAGTASQHRDEGGTRRVRQAPLRPPLPRGPARARGPQARVAPGGTPQATGAGAVTERRMRSWACASAPVPCGARRPRCGRGALLRQGADAGRGRPGAGLPNPNPRRRPRCCRLLVVPPGRLRAPRVVGVASAEPPGHVTMGLVARAQNT